MDGVSTAEGVRTWRCWLCASGDSTAEWMSAVWRSDVKGDSILKTTFRVHATVLVVGGGGELGGNIGPQSNAYPSVWKYWLVEIW